MDWKDLLKPESRVALLKNFKEQEPRKGSGREIDLIPVTRLIVEGSDMMWLLTECDGEGMAFGLCQIQYAELGYVWLPEVAELDLEGVRVIEDPRFNPILTIREYAALARKNGGFLEI